MPWVTTEHVSLQQENRKQRSIWFFFSSCQAVGGLSFISKVIPEKGLRSLWLLLGASATKDLSGILMLP